MAKVFSTIKRLQSTDLVKKRAGSVSHLIAANEFFEAGSSVSSLALPLLSSSSVIYAPFVSSGIMHSYVADGPDANTNVINMTSLPADALLVVTMVNNDDDSLINFSGSVTSSPSLTWTQRVNAEVSVACNVEIWTAPFMAGGDIIVTATWGTVSQTTSVCYAFTNALVGAGYSQLNASAPNLSATVPVRAYVVGAMGDWQANAGPATYRSAVTESEYDYQSGLSTQYHFFTEETSAGTYSYGLTAPTSDNGYNIGLLIIEPEAGGSSQSLTVPLLTNASTLYDPTVTRGAVTITAPLLSNASTIFAPTVQPGAMTITAPLFTNASTLYSPSVTVGAVVITAPLLTDGDTLYSHTINPQAVSITIPLLTNSSALYTHTIQPGAQTVTAPLLTNTPTLYAPVVQIVERITLPLLTNASTLYTPTITTGAVSITAPLLTNASTLYTPTITTGAVSITAPLLSNINALYAPNIGLPPLELSMAFINSTGQLYMPVVSAGAAQLTLPVMSDSDTLHAPTVTRGAVTVTAPFISSSASLFAPVITSGSGLKIYINGQWVPAVFQVWNGAQWTGTTNYYNGSNWVEV